MINRSKKDVLPRTTTTTVNLKKRRGVKSKRKSRKKVNKCIIFFVLPVTAVLSFCIGGYTFYKLSLSSTSTSTSSSSSWSSSSKSYPTFKVWPASKTVTLVDDDTIEPSFPYFGSSVLDVLQYEPLGGERFTEYKDGEVPYDINERDIKISNHIANERKQHIKNAMKFAWDGYTTRAYGADEIKPVTGRPNKKKFGGIAVTLVDALDTLWIMDMKEEFELARQWIKDHLSFDTSTKVSVFETTIRSLGGLLSAYEWSGATVFLEKAEDLATRLLKSFDRSIIGIPFAEINLSTGQSNNSKWSKCKSRSDVCGLIAEVGSLQVEFGTLAKNTNNPQYREMPDAAFDKLKSLEVLNGLYSNMIEVTNVGQLKAPPGGVLTFGGTTDSFYEYMLKLWLQGNKKEDKYRDMYDKAIESMHNLLLTQSPATQLWIIGNIRSKHMRKKQAQQRRPQLDHPDTHRRKREKYHERGDARRKLGDYDRFDPYAHRGEPNDHDHPRDHPQEDPLDFLYYPDEPHDPDDHHRPRGGRQRGEPYYPDHLDEPPDEPFYPDQPDDRNDHHRPRDGRHVKPDPHSHHDKPYYPDAHLLRPDHLQDPSFDNPHQSQGLSLNMEHLTCFMGGLLALGAYTDPQGIESKRAQRDLKTARAVTYTCYQMYALMPTGLAPESFDGKNGYRPARGAAYYLLRPETVESLYILHFLTKDPIYREWGWEIFQSIEKYCKTAFGYGEYDDVTEVDLQPRDSTESFFFAETLKYLYLLFDTESEIDILNKHVFNTEAHPLRVFKD